MKVFLLSKVTSLYYIKVKVGYLLCCGPFFSLSLLSSPALTEGQWSCTTKLHVRYTTFSR